MKKLILAAFALTAAASVFAQGTIVFNNYEASSTSETRIYAPLATSGTNMYVSQMGNASTDKPAGTTLWTGYTLIGTTLSGQFGGSETMAELLAAPGLNNAASLAPATAGGITTFRTSTAGLAGPAGLVAGTTPTFDNIPLDYSGGATIEMVVWDDSSGLYGTWALASAAWLKGTIAAGESPLMNITATIGGTAVPPNFPSSDESFNLYYIQVPEPATFALAGLGVATLLVFRRRK